MKRTCTGVGYESLTSMAPYRICVEVLGRDARALGPFAQFEQANVRFTEEIITCLRLGRSFTIRLTGDDHLIKEIRHVNQWDYVSFE